MRPIHLSLLVTFGLFLTACGSISEDVPSLETTPTPNTDAETLDGEILMVEFDWDDPDAAVDYEEYESQK
jgi:hypothetical protein